MEKFMIYNRHYIMIDSHDCIIDGWSDGPHPEKDTTNAICINENGGHQFRIVPNGEENLALFTEDMIPLYKWDGEKVIPRSDDEIKADHDAKPIPAHVPTELEKLRADLDYTMLMMGLDVSET